MSPRVNVALQEAAPRVDLSLHEHIFSPVSRRGSSVVSARTQSVATYRTVSGIGALNESLDSIDEEERLTSLLSESNRSNRSSDLRNSKIKRHMSIEDNEMLV